ncbi:molybdopterin synthase catalytic subunit [Haloactinopolyspora alba]|uniref:Molybdopterin synthase catalytic subunit 1 n=1 Tax=Haloactinopolyspora alba TaxID=648780 RepID=A0A2P8EAZ9_9ACTN|nr:molybdenum cofactor biosynthesis protein MoaE [Haloactinopolyspora alba]PSL06630.1 molybdopterin synthase catalytic subunit [Haloactinopolyspora alba]
MDAVTLLGVRDTALSVDEVLAAVADPAAGGTCFFVGTVRDIDDGRPVTGLTYEAHPTVEETLRTVAEKVAAEVPVRALAAVHRVGRLEIGEPAVVVAAAAEHRQEAFTACRRLIDDLKRDVPIWKHQTFGDGTDEWVGAP